MYLDDIVMWQGFLTEFDFVLEYKPSTMIVVAGVLSSKVEREAISQSQFPLLMKLKKGMKHDSLAKYLVECVKEEKTCREHVFVLKWGNVWRKILKVS